MEEAHSDRAVAELIRATQALAMEWHIQRSLFPAFVIVPDELALNFEDARGGLQERVVLSSPQRDALELLRTLLESMTESSRPELWTEAGLRESAEWQQVRMAARTMLEAFGSRIEAPPSYEARYVEGVSPKATQRQREH